MSEHHTASRLVGQDIDHVAVYKGDTLSLWEKRGEDYCQVTAVIPTNDLRYTRLKQIAHLHVLITMIIDECLKHEEGHRSGIKKLVEEVLPKITLIERHLHALHADDIPIQATILGRSRECIEQLTHMVFPFSKSEILSLREDYVGRLQAAIHYNNRTATTTQLHCLHDIVGNWQTNYGLEPGKSRVIIVSTHGPRIGRIETQYFERWYKDNLKLEAVEDNLLYSIEMLPSQFDTLDIKKDLIEGFLMGSELNKDIGNEILGNRKKMFSDVLESYAMPVLDSLFKDKNMVNTARRQGRGGLFVSYC